MTHQSLTESFREQVDIAIVTTGYTMVDRKDAHAYAVVGKQLLESVLQCLKDEFPLTRFGLVHGSTPQGFDLITQQVAARLGLPQIGVTCPQYAVYLPPSSGFPIVWAEDAEKFGSTLTQLGDFVLQFGGRKGAIQATIAAVSRQKKFGIVVSPHEALYGRGDYGTLAQVDDFASSVVARTITVQSPQRNQFPGIVQQTLSELIPRLRVIKTSGCLRNSVNARALLKEVGLPELPDEPLTVKYPVPALFKRGNKSVLWNWTERQPKEFVKYDANANAWLVEKEFSKLTLVLEKDAHAISSYLADADTLVLGPTGFSSLKPADLEILGLQEGDYEHAVEAYLCSVANGLREAFPGLSLVLADGASDAGVDRAAISASKRLSKFGVQRVGHTCFKYLQYVNDEEAVVIVSDTPAKYADMFTKHIDVLFALGGREHALELDIAAVSCSPNKLLVIPQLIQSISGDGAAPPARCGAKLVDATRLFGTHLRIVSPSGSDPLQSTIQGAGAEACDIVRRLLPGKARHVGMIIVITKNNVT